MSLREPRDAAEVEYMEDLADRLLREAESVQQLAERVHADAFDREELTVPSDEVDGEAVEELVEAFGELGETIEEIEERAG